MFSKTRVLLVLLLIPFRRGSAFQSFIEHFPSENHPNVKVQQHKAPLSLLSAPRPYSSSLKKSTQLDGRRWMPEWDGDDVRWRSRLRRRFARRSEVAISTHGSIVKNTLISINWILFLYQSITTVNFIRKGHRSYWPRQALSIISDVLLGNSVNGPMTRDFYFSNALSHRQPHRYVTSGFIHQSVIHFLINMITLRNQPSWLALGLGGPLYLTTYLTSIITGNMAHQYYLNNPFDRSLSLGSSGAIGGIYGLMYVQVMRMGNGGAMFRVLKGMTFLFLLGTLIDNVSVASQVGGFLGGALVGLLCAPTYQKSYSMRRKNSVEYDPLSRDYRQTAGFGVLPTESGYVPLWILWTVMAVLFATAERKFRRIPSLILKGLLSPGSLAR